MGMPPSASPASASRIAASRNESIIDSRGNARRRSEGCHQDRIKEEGDAKADEPRVFVDLHPEGPRLDESDGRAEARQTDSNTGRQGDECQRIESGDIPVRALAAIETGQVEPG